MNTDTSRITPLRLMEENGKFEGVLFEAIEAFQRNTAGVTPNGLVEPGGPTLRALRAGMPAEFVRGKLQGIIFLSIN